METLPVPISALVLCAAGAAFLYTAVRAHATGELPAGSKGFRAYRPRRDESPGAFYFFQLLYVTFGSWLAIHGVLVAIGRAAPLALR
ncbi:MAG: hypothetical protein DCC71_07145 [Proteobacteria bacterium]|nr:MAG: hypothetical protein DCC71_07145 [Pseudomonadota bacterium]